MLLPTRQLLACATLASSAVAGSPGDGVELGHYEEEIQHPISPLPAVGINLGQSYGTAAAHLSNGTVINLARIEGSPEYAAFMQREVLKDVEAKAFWHFLYHPDYDSPLIAHFKGLLKQEIKYPERTVVLGDMVRQLVAESQKVLGERLQKSVGVSAPFMTAWQDDVPFSSVINDLLHFSQLEPVFYGIGAPMYVQEASAVLVANGRRECKASYCGSGVSTKEEFPHDTVYYIGLTDSSLQTAFQDNECLGKQSHSNKDNLINSEFGLEQRSKAKNAAAYWAGVKKHIVERFQQVTASEGDSPKSYGVVLAGEAALEADFAKTVKAAIKEIASAKKAERKIELLVSEDPVYAAARGAAFWVRRALDRQYCFDLWDEKLARIQAEKAEAAAKEEKPKAGEPAKAKKGHDEL